MIITMMNVNMDCGKHNITSTSENGQGKCEN